MKIRYVFCKIVIYLAVVFLYACQQRECYPNMRTPEQLARYAAINDSMQHLTPSAMKLIEEQMAQADDSLTYYDYYLMRGRSHLLSDTPDSSLLYADRTIRFARRQEPTPRTRGLLAMAYNCKASYLYLLHHSPDSIISLYSEAYRLTMQSDMKDNLPDISANMGDAYVEKNDLAQAASWYRRALFLVDSLGLPRSRNLTLNLGLGRIYTNMHNFRTAKEYYDDVEAHFDQMKPNMQSYFLNNYGNYFYYQHDYPSALSTFKRLKAHLEQYHAEENFDMYLCKINLADVYLNMNQTDSAALYVKEAEDYFLKNGVDVAVYYAHTIRIGIAMKCQQYQEVEDILRQESPTLTATPDLVGIREHYMDNYYATKGDYKKAYANMRRHIMAEDSTQQSLKHMQSVEIMTRLTEDTLRMHHQLAMNAKNETVVRTQIAMWAAIALIVILLLVFYAWLMYNRKRNLQRNMDVLMLRLDNARQRISPHFVFNILNSRIHHTDHDEADQLTHLAKLIRTNLDMASQPFISLREEIDFVEQYIRTEATLIGEDFDYEIEKPENEELAQIMIPSMFVQILTENAILHGIKGREGHKLLLIKITTDEKETRIAVRDNGPGFDIRNSGGKRTKTGLNIIRQTLLIINGMNTESNRMSFDLHNLTDDEGKTCGCESLLIIPKNIIL